MVHEPDVGVRTIDGPRSQQSPGHEHPSKRTIIRNYRELLAFQKYADPEIAARVEAASEGTEKLSPIVPDVERLLGPAKPVEVVLDALDHQYKEQGKPAVWFLPPNKPIAPHLDELIGSCRSTDQTEEPAGSEYVFQVFASP